MNILTPRRDAEKAVASNESRPATAIVHDSPEARLLVFRIAPGQRVAPHRNASSVILSVLAGSGVVTGEHEEREVHAGEFVCYAPNELHAMRAVDEELQLLAIISPRPGAARG